MAANTGIEWTDATWNPIVGCSIVSPGCTNCYAMTMAARLERMNHSLDHYGGTTKRVNGNAVWTGKVALAPDHILTQPLHWKKPRRIFVNSMGDLFHEAVPDEWIDQVFAVMALAPQHTFQVLTKRSKRMRAYLTDIKEVMKVASEMMTARLNQADTWLTDCGWSRPRNASVSLASLPNVWLGVSTEDQARADERIPDLLATPAAIRFVSAEPLLSGLDLTRVGTLATIAEAFPKEAAREARGRPLQGDGSISNMQIDAIGSQRSEITFFQTPDHMGGFSATSPRSRPTLDWIIAGGESGPGARPMHPDWLRSIRDQCAAAGVAFFFKQWGEWHPVHQLLADGNSNTMTGREHPDKWHEATLSGRVGKRRAGRLLDGIEHSAMPVTDP